MDYRADNQYANYHYNPESRILFRVLQNNKQLLWRPPFHGTPAFNKEVYDKFKDKIDWLGYKLDGEKYTCALKEFDSYKELITDKEPQYAVNSFFWCHI